ncbi:MAG TPA: DUF1924 domain-containing protein [Burkholderiales bacterium]|nr:DUF1924 domain-containing protein [Burkholderiales bacterium]
METNMQLETLRIRAGVALLLFASAALAATPAELLRGYETAARADNARFAGFSAERGRELFNARRGEWSCASCHTDNPAAQGKHAKTAKVIAPLAPAANAERFTDAAATEKWFRRNCNDVLARACTAQEKGDILQYLISVKQEAR